MSGELLRERLFLPSGRYINGLRATTAAVTAAYFSAWEISATMPITNEAGQGDGSD